MHQLLLGLFFLAAQPAEVPPSETWPQWRGPTHNSVSPTANLPTHWSKTENVRWKTPPLPGRGHSVPAIWKDAIFLTAHDGESLLAMRFDRGTGKIVWQREVGKGTPRKTGGAGPNRFHDENTMASPSPVTDGKHVWFHFGNGDLACYDFDGNRIWAHNLTDRFGIYSIWWGHANSPLLVGDMLISVCMQDPKGGGKSYVVAHDKLTGKEKWQAMRETGATSEPADSYATPIPYQHNGRTEAIVFGAYLLDAYDPLTGKQLWQCKAFKGNRVIPTPTVAGDTIYAIEGMKGPLYAIRAGGDGDVTATAVLWKYPGSKGTPDAASPVIAKGLIFLATNDGFGICVDMDKGQELWKERLCDAFRATPLVAGDKVYFFGKEGKTVVVEAARQLKIIAQSDLGEDTVASPAVAGNELFIRTRGHLWCIDNKK